MIMRSIYREFEMVAPSGAWFPWSAMSFSVI